MDSPCTLLAAFSNCHARAHSWGHRGETVTVKAKKRNEPRSFRLAAVAAAALAAGFLAWIGPGSGARPSPTLVSNLVQASAALLAAGGLLPRRPPQPLRLRPGLDRVPAPGLAPARLGRPGLGPRPGRLDHHRAPRTGAGRAVAGRRRLPDRGAAADRRGAGLPDRPHAGHGPAPDPAGRPADRRLPAVPRLGHRARRRLHRQRRRPLDPGAGHPASPTRSATSWPAPSCWCCSPAPAAGAWSTCR